MAVRVVIIIIIIIPIKVSRVLEYCIVFSILYRGGGGEGWTGLGTLTGDAQYDIQYPNEHPGCIMLVWGTGMQCWGL